jgi:xanthine/uracil/vitamin C permease (AzgA family)
MGKYRTARSILSIIEICGWLFVALVVFGFAKAMRDGLPLDLYLFAAAFLGIAIGLAMIAAVQIARAVIDTAENTAELVKLMRPQSPPTGRQEPSLRSL